MPTIWPGSPAAPRDLRSFLDPTALQILKATGRVETEADPEGGPQRPTAAARRRYLDHIAAEDRRRRLEAVQREVRAGC